MLLKHLIILPNVYCNNLHLTCKLILFRSSRPEVFLRKGVLNLLHILGRPFPKNAFGGLLLYIMYTEQTNENTFTYIRSSHWRCSARKNAFRKRHFIKKETLTLVFSCEFCEISKNTFFTEHLRATISENTLK